MCPEYTGPTYTDMHTPLSGGGAESPAGSQREGAAGGEGRSRRAKLTQATELPTAKQGAQTHSQQLRHEVHSSVATLLPHCVIEIGGGWL